jgi:hypothetical protein
MLRPQARLETISLKLDVIHLMQVSFYILNSIKGEVEINSLIPNCSYFIEELKLPPSLCLQLQRI